MPKLLLFTPCLKAITGDDGLLTVVSILENVSISVPQDMDLDEEIATPLQWQMTSIWYRTPQDLGKQFEQSIELELPNQKRFLLNQHPLDLKESRTTRVRSDGEVFPVGLAGEHILRVQYREVISEEWIPVAEYPVLVIHNPE